MNKKIIIGCISIIFILTTITTATNNRPANSYEKKTSPLFSIRTNKAIQNERVLLNSRFIKSRIFIIAFKGENTNKNLQIRNLIQNKNTAEDLTCQYVFTICNPTHCMRPTDCGVNTCSGQHTCANTVCTYPCQNS